MSGFRPLLVPLTAAWLSLHFLVMTGPAIVALISPSSAADTVCTCAHGADHGTCPMHRTRTDANRCGLRGTQDDLATALVSVVGPLALPTTVSVAFLDTDVPDSTGYSSALPSDWIVPPEPPPPRN